jgi:hypothetical protein
MRLMNKKEGQMTIIKRGVWLFVLPELDLRLTPKILTNIPLGNGCDRSVELTGPSLAKRTLELSLYRRNFLPQ